MTIKDHYIDIVSGKQLGVLPLTVKTFLFSVSCVYRLILRLRSSAYQIGLIKKRNLAVPVISVGNITVGGTGKTPFIEYVATYLKGNGINVVILSRGYGARTKNNETFNDEHLLLIENLGNIPNIMGKDRAATGELAIEKHNANCILLDDGFQHTRLKRKLDIVLISALNPFGYENVLPRGLLREPLHNLNRADLFVITHCNLCTREELYSIQKRLNLINSKAPVTESIHHPRNITNIKDNSSLPMEWLNKKRVYAFCAIGNPDSFSRLLKLNGADIIKFKTFEDHYFYENEDLAVITKEAEQLGVDTIVTTQKDKVKILRMVTKEELRSHAIPLCIINIAIKITKGREIIEKVIDETVVTTQVDRLKAEVINRF